MSKSKSVLSILSAALLAAVLFGCAVEPEIIVVEITRVVREEVEVTRIFEIEKEVTRIVEVPLGQGSGASSSDQFAGQGLDFLQVELWPDYDQPAMLVLLTGQIADGVALPAQISIPLPEGAQVHAVAQIDQSGMTSTDHALAPGAVVFENSTPGFRVEYYVPYLREGDERSFDFEWRAPFPVRELAVQIQKPANASQITSKPTPNSTYTEPSDGLSYLRFDPVAVLAGQLYRLRLQYQMTSDGLSADEPGSESPDIPGNPLHGQQA